MEFIAHRVNTAEELKGVPETCGVEIDLRDWAGRLILSHDPFREGEDFESWLKGYRHGTIICNIKSERIEHKVIELVKNKGIKTYFFLDSSFPMMHLLAGEGERNLAVRYSEYEGLDTVMAMKGRAGWVWVDCFTRLPIDANSYAALKEAGFKLCLVSPELQGQAEKIPEYATFLRQNGIEMDAICCKMKNMDLWNEGLGI